MADDIDLPITTDSANAALLTNLVNALTYIQRQYSGGVPASPVAFQIIVDTTTTPDSIKIRNAANSAWVTLCADITTAGGGLLPTTGGTMTGDISLGTTQRITNMAAPSAGGDAVTKTANDARTLCSAVYIGTLSATTTVDIFLTPQAYSKIQAAYLVTATALSTSGTDYWTFDCYNVTDTAYLQTGAGPTTPTLGRLAASTYTGGTAIVANTPFSLSLNQNQGDLAATLAASKVIQLIATKTGAPTSLAGCTLFVWYKVST